LNRIVNRLKFGTLNIKIALLVVGAVIILLILIYTQLIIDKIQNREREIVRLYAKSIEYIANDVSPDAEYTFIFEEIIHQIDFPVIATNRTNDTITIAKNIEIDSTLPRSKQIEKMLSMTKEMDEMNPPIKVTVGDSIVLNYVHYGQSTLITGLKILPIFGFLVGGIFLLFGYIGFSYIKKTEQGNIWVGLSRETAHQLGTPLTSLIGWVEMLKVVEPQSGELREIINEIESDIDKLNKIAGRFSKIGSQPKLKDENVTQLIKKVSNYFEKRIPSLVGTDGEIKKKVKIDISSENGVAAKINKDLFEWVIENLLKNAIDAMDKQSGNISFEIQDKEREVVIDVTDTGKGIDVKYKKDVFRPGYSTKMRGWGLGLSLSKRIIEDYHKGKLILLDSNLGKGTTFRIKLNKN
jgi:hypothetical protein